MSKKLKLVGQRFGRLLILREYGKTKFGKINWICLCDCGNFKVVLSNDLKRGYTKSCGCLWKEVVAMRKGKNNPNYKHGEAIANIHSRLYRTWMDMKVRCYNSNRKIYQWYGNKRISVCSAWRNNYIVFRKWALSNGYKDDLTIDRKNNKGNYEPSNCQFLTRSENIKKRFL